MRHEQENKLTHLTRGDYTLEANHHDLNKYVI